MSVLRHTQTLFTRAAADTATDDATGASARVKPSDSDSIADHQAAYSFWFKFVTTGGTSPTLDARIEHSADGVTFTTLVSMTQVTSATTFAELKTPNSNILPHVRAVITAGGTADPSWYGDVVMASNNPFTLV